MTIWLLAAVLNLGPEARTALSLTIYNEGIALVRETRIAELPKGQHTLLVKEVPARILADSLLVRPAESEEDFRLLEQNYEYDLASRPKLLSRYIGKKIYFRVQEKDETRLLEGILLSTDGLVRIGDKIHTAFPGTPILPELPEGIFLKPTLLWLVETRRAGRYPLEFSYLTQGIRWEASYVGMLNPENTEMSLSAWITVTNESGAAYEDAALQFIAGKIQRARRPTPYRAEVRLMKQAPEVTAEAFFEYHLYTLARRTTIRRNEVKQILFLEAPRVAVQKQYLVLGWQGAWQQRTPGKRAVPVGVYLEFENTKAQGLGVALPAGIVRIYQRDSSGRAQFLGEDRIGHTPRNESLTLKVGEAFDLRAERALVRYRDLGNCDRFTVEYSLRNRKKEEVEIEVREYAPAFAEWDILDSSHPWERLTQQAFRFRVRVPPDAEETLRFTLQICV